MAQTPHILWLFGDQHPAHLLSGSGSPNLRTPHLDMMARRGTRFKRAIAGYPLCCPFRGSLLTSRYPHQCVTGHQMPMDPAFPTAADAFKAHGYRTGYFGKWHVDGFKETGRNAVKHTVTPDRRGRFDDWMGYENNNQQFDCWLHGHLYGEEQRHRKLPGYETDAMTDLFIDYLQDHFQQRVDQPLFAVMSVQPPHDPYWATAEEMASHRPADIQLRANVPPIPRIQDQARQTLAGACAQIENLDMNVGRILKAIEEAGELENTVIFFFSDHGDMHGSHGLWRKHVPYQESVNIPMIVFDGAPGSQYPADGHTVDFPINHVDILPTSLGMADLPMPEFVQGSDCSGFVKRNGRTDHLPREGYLQNLTGGFCMLPYRGIVTVDGYKYIAAPDTPWMCFDLNEDPYELNNLALEKHNRGLIGDLNDRLQQWIDKTEDEFQLPTIPAVNAYVNT